MNGPIVPVSPPGVQMRLFRVQKEGSDKIEEVTARNEAEALEMFTMGGIKATIVGSVDPIKPPQSDAPHTRGTYVPETNRLPPPPPPSVPVLEFEIEGKKCKVENGKVFVKDWQDVNPKEEYRITPEGVIQQLQWIEKVT